MHLIYLSLTHRVGQGGTSTRLKDKTDRESNTDAILTLSKIIEHVMSSASEAETAAFFLNYKAAISLRIVLEEMGHSQPKTRVVTDNSSAERLINKTMIPKRAKGRGMMFNWLKCREAQKMFDFIPKKVETTKLIIIPKITELFIVRIKEEIIWQHQQPKYNGGTCSSKSVLDYWYNLRPRIGAEQHIST